MRHSHAAKRVQFFDYDPISWYVYGMGTVTPTQVIPDPHVRLYGFTGASFNDGNTVRFTWSETNLFGAGNGNLVRVTSPNGGCIDFTYAPGTTRVTQVQDNLGRTVSYGYDTNGNLTSVTDPEQHVTRYTYDSGNRLVSVKTRNLDGTPTALVMNEYDTPIHHPDGRPSRWPSLGVGSTRRS